MFNIEPTYYYAIAGAIGALINDMLEDNSIALPKYEKGKLALGFIGPMIVGACAGQYIDGQISTAFMGGFIGKSVITNLIPKNPLTLLSGKSTKIDKTN